MKNKLFICLVVLLSLSTISLNKVKATEPLGTCRTNLYDYYANYTQSMCDEIGGGWSPYDVPYVPDYDNDGNRVMNWSDYDEIIEEDGEYFGIIEIQTKFLWLGQPGIGSSYVPNDIKSMLFLGFNYSLNDLMKITIEYDHCDIYFFGCIKKSLDKELIITDENELFSNLFLNYDEMITARFNEASSLIEKMREEDLQLSDFDYMLYLPLTDNDVIGDKISIVRLKYELGEPVYDDDGNLIADDGDIIDEVLEEPVDVENSSDDGDFDFDTVMAWLFGENFVSDAKEIGKKVLVGIIVSICVMLCIAFLPVIISVLSVIWPFVKMGIVAIVKLIISPLVLIFSLLRKSNVKKQFR